MVLMVFLPPGIYVVSSFERISLFACDCTVWGLFPALNKTFLCCFPFPALLQTKISPQKMKKQPSIKDDAIPATAPFLHLQKPCQEIAAAFYTRVPGNKNKSLVPSKCEHKNLIKVRFLPN